MNNTVSIQNALKSMTALYYITNEPPDKLVMQELIEKGDKTFAFILNYCSPPDQFGELSRYRNELDLAAGRSGRFEGNVVIDLNQWTDDDDSPYLDAFLAYLFDHREKVRYVFVTTVDHRREWGIYRKLSDYFPVEQSEIDLYSADFLGKHFETVFGECVLEKFAQKDAEKLCNILSASAKQYDMTLHSLEIACEKLINSKKGRITSKDIDKFINSNHFIKLGGSQKSQFGITQTDERW